jgi:methylglyoxal synthase
LHYQPTDKKTLIGVLASHDDVQKNNDLARLFDKLHNKANFRKFHFVFTSGTYQRIILGKDTEPRRRGLKPIKKGKTIGYLKSNSTVLPDRRNGGVTLLANLVVQRQCSIIWPFLSPITGHWLNPENLALMRLCDIWNVKRLMNSGSVETWFRDEAKRDADRNPQEIPLRLHFGGGELKKDLWKGVRSVDAQWSNQWNEASDYFLFQPDTDIPKPKVKGRLPKFWHEFQHQTIALIAHDEMKRQMVDFAIEYGRELSKFGRILATGTTGRDVEEATRELKGKIIRCRSGPKGGDIEIATEILYGRCDVVIFFIDPLRPHPHMEDIRVVFAACMIENGVRMLSNEVQAREWMDEVVRPNVAKVVQLSHG